MTALEMLVKQTEYEVKTLDMILRMKRERKSLEDIAKEVGVSTTEVRIARPKGLERAKERLERYKRGLN
ncbi:MULTISPECIES: hypothetical protein [Bacillaceae]|jgi:DNA-directed RNA polymerase specialized sigma24 family protein|uniref:hypothetical protein n=1 Tax=Bacillaceae TaxID=186817 RepID=UPI00145FAA24|nr:MULTISPECIES: hypothetical protein [Bacillaceae]MCM3571982.1 hypothetical protein [Mesobacillus subterraneus]NMD70619.1 hypothetical protein [Bacillus sp. DNRA2]